MNSTEREKTLLNKLNNECGNIYGAEWYNSKGELCEIEYDMHFEVYDETGEVAIVLTYCLSNEICCKSIFYDKETDEEIVEMVKKRIEKGFDLDL